MRLASRVKNWIVPPECKPRAILTGPFQGIVMNLSLRTQTQFWIGIFEKETHPWLARLSQGAATAIDIGVAHGEHTIYFLTKTKAATVLAFEPDASCMPSLRANLALNGVDRSSGLSISTKFVGASDGEREIRLDSLASSVTSPCIVKMDVDGGEERILDGAANFNTLPDVRWLIETHSKDLEIACRRILTAAGFQTRVIPNAWWRVLVPEMRPCDHNRWLAAWKNEQALR